MPIRGLVAAAHPAAAEAGAGVLREGGNAVDAVAATALAMGVVQPLDCGLGGGGFLLLHMAETKETKALDFMSAAPAKAQYQLVPRWGGFLRDYSLLVAGRHNERGGRSVAVPGAPAGLAAALQRYGRLPLTRLVAPAVKLADDGFTVNAYLARRMRDNLDYLTSQPETTQLFTRGGQPYREGEVLRNPDLAQTLGHVAEEGLESCYHGAIGSAIVSLMERLDGFVDADDLAAYRPIWKEPVRGRYRDLQVAAMPPPSSGAYLVLALYALAQTDLANIEPGSPDIVQALLEALQIMSIERGSGLGDPAYVPVPVQELIAPERAWTSLIALREGRLRPTGAGPGEAGIEGHDTTHISVVDRHGNLAALTYSLMNFSGVTVPGCGFMLNNQMLLFHPWPGTSNSVEPGKRPASSMTPTLLLKNGHPAGALGASGGPRILSAMLQTLVQWRDFGLPPAAAVAAPRLHWEGGRVLAEPGIVSAVRAAAGDMPVEEMPPGDDHMGVCQCVFIDPQTGTAAGAADRRGGGAAVAE
jgi:gamma-glutamyltranspeptidase/glutathione hydrolase